MNRQSCKKMTAEMIDEAAKWMNAKIDKAMNCGALDIEDYDEDYQLPKIILAALLEDALENWKSPFAEDRKTSDNLYTFL